MFSFRTTPVSEQLDKALTDGPVSVVCTQNCWDSGRYLYDVFSQRGNLAKVYMPSEGHIAFDVEDFREVAAVVVEIQDIGCRWFPYAVDVLRLVSDLRSLGDDAPSLYVVDHFNPAGRDVEGTLPAGESDIWTPKVAHRHGLTLGELVHLYHSEVGAAYPLHIISAAASTASRTFLPWAIPPSEDAPGMFTPYLYSGGSLWRDTTVNPGLGTGRPYEFIGAPFVKPGEVPAPAGVVLRPCSFIPREGLYEGEQCFGYQFLLTPEAHYNSLLHTVYLMRYFLEHYSQFEIREELYTRLADPVMAEYLKGRITFDIVTEHVKDEEQKWIRKAKRYILYDDQPCRIK